MLVIDEAYMLAEGQDGKDSLNVLVEQVQEGMDMAIIMCGYEKEMLDMIRDGNPGLRRRFSPEQALKFENLSDEEIGRALKMALQKQNVSIPMRVRKVAQQELQKLKQQPNFGNFGTVIDFVRNAKLHAIGNSPTSGGSKVRLSADDLMSAVGKTLEDAIKDPLDAINSLFGLSEVRKSLQRLSTSVAVARRDGLEQPKVQGWTFVGSPGTGKTTVARALAGVLHRLGLLATANVHAVKGGDLQGQYVGKAQQNVNEAFREAAGKVLLIDEAYSMMSGGLGGYGSQVVDTLCGCMTEPKYDGSEGLTVVVLAGYEKEINGLLDTNPGLKSRFTRRLRFADWSPEEATKFACQLLEAKGAFQLEASSGAGGDGVEEELLSLFTRLSMRPGWGNARDVKSVVVPTVRAMRSERVAIRREPVKTYAVSDVQIAAREVLASRPVAAAVLPAFPAGAPMAMMAAAGHARAAAPPPPRAAELEAEADHDHDHEEECETEQGEEPSYSDEELRKKREEEEAERKRLEEELR